MARMKPLPKLVLLVVIVGGFIWGLRTAMSHGLIPAPGVAKAILALKADLPDVKDAQIENVTPLPIPSSATVSVDSVPIRSEVWAWNAQMAYLYANGGPQTTRDSLMQKHGVNLTIINQNDTAVMQQDLVACANQLHSGATSCDTGTNFVNIMGDGAGQFFSAVNPQLKKLGPEYQAEVVGSVGYSRGEDKAMVTPACKKNPQACKGILMAGVILDGDWNIMLKWSHDNQIKNNPDEKTWDPDAINWVNAPDYLKAVEMYNSGFCEERNVVKDGRFTGEKKNVCVGGVVTWTPGDVNVAHGKGGLVSLVSSKQYRSQMPNVLIGIKKFDRDNRREVEGLLAASFEAADQIKAYPEALQKAGEISAKVYNDKDAKYWIAYYKGTKERDSQGNEVELGGSYVNNLADNLVLFGLAPGANNNYRSTYTTFAKIAEQQYPQRFAGEKKIPPVNEVVDTSYVLGAQSRMGEASAPAEDVKFSGTGNTGTQVSKRAWAIHFDTGQATLTPEGEQTMSEIKDDLAIAGGLYATVDGYTDNTGSHPFNVDLSQRRAQTVVSWLRRKSPASFPAERFRVAGHGEQNAVAPNTSEDGRAKNRRVEITLSETD